MARGQKRSNARLTTRRSVRRGHSGPTRTSTRLGEENGLSHGSIRLARFNGLRLSCLFSVDHLGLRFQLSGHFLENDPVGLMARSLRDVEAVPCPIMKAFCVIPHRGQTNGPTLTFRLLLHSLMAGMGGKRTLASSSWQSIKSADCIIPITEKEPRDNRNFPRGVLTVYPLRAAMPAFGGKLPLAQKGSTAAAFLRGP